MNESYKEISEFLVFLKEKAYSKYIKFISLTPEKIKILNLNLERNIKNLEKSIDKIKKNESSLKIIKEFKEKSFDEIFKISSLNTRIFDFVFKTYEKKKERRKLHKNVLLIGNEGVGKSTLINSFLKINEAPTGIGKAVTQKFISYTSKPDNYFRLYDSKGFSIVNDYTEQLKQIEKFIEEKLKADNQDEFIHCIWYCFTGDRYNDKEKEAIKILLNKYEDDCLPIIVVYLKFWDINEANIYLNQIKDYLGNENKKINFMPVRALSKKYNDGYEDKETKSYGLEKLEKETNERMINAINSSYYQSIRNRIIDSYQKSITDKYNDIKKKIEYMTTLINYYSIEFLNFEMFFDEAFKFIFFDEKNNIQNEQIKNILKNIKKICEKFLEDLKNSYIQEFQKRLDSVFDNIIKECFPQLLEKEHQSSKNEILKEISEELREYYNIEKENDISEKNKFIMLNLINESFEQNLKETKKPEINCDNLAQEVEEDEFSDLLDEKINVINTNRDIKLNYESKSYQITNRNIYNLKNIEHKTIIEIIRFVMNIILDKIKEYFNSQMGNLKNIINKEIIQKIKEEKEKELIKK